MNLRSMCGARMRHSLHSHLLHEAAELLGGPRALGYKLQVPARDLARWMAGLEPMPRLVFLKVVDLILELTSEELAAPIVVRRLSCGGDVRRMDQRKKAGERDAR